jgi:glycosyltransferase involved in cell wall biosynthesis
VTFGGYRQIDEIAAYYGLAGAFVHPAIVEQWGLVINEAMATGLPVVVSRSVGAVEDLVIDGENGYRFDPRDPSAIAKALLRVSAPDADRARMGRSSRERVAHWSLDRFAEGLWQAVVAGAESADRSMPLGVRALVWSNQRSPGALLRWRSVEP